MKHSDYSVTWAKELLKGAELRATAARIAVLQQLAATSKPLTHANLVDQLADYGFDQSTVFRALGDLSDAGLVARLDLGDQLRRYELVGTSAPHGPAHPHFMCVDCGTVSCLDSFSFQLTPSRGPRRDRVGEITEVLLKGHCGSCLEG